MRMIKGNQFFLGMFLNLALINIAYSGEVILKRNYDNGGAGTLFDMYHDEEKIGQIRTMPERLGLRYEAIVDASNALNVKLSCEGTRGSSTTTDRWKSWNIKKRSGSIVKTRVYNEGSIGSNTNCSELKIYIN